jgi:hypothetical protein
VVDVVVDVVVVGRDVVGGPVVDVLVEVAIGGLVDVLVEVTIGGLVDVLVDVLVDGDGSVAGGSVGTVADAAKPIELHASARPTEVSVSTRVRDEIIYGPPGSPHASSTPLRRHPSIPPGARVRGVHRSVARASRQ